MSATQSREEESILQAIQAAKGSFGPKCPRKYIGALTIECIRRSLAEHGIRTSPRDVFITGVRMEIDMIVPRSRTIPENGVLYKGDDALAAIEVKNHGVFGKGSSSCERLRQSFQEIQSKYPKIWCAYVTLSERESYKNKITTENLGFPAYTLFWDPTGKRHHYESTGHWMLFVNELKKSTGSAISVSSATQN
jgi:hypothetical protein